MSYEEYFDMFWAAQKKDCKYRAFMIDVKDSRNVLIGKKYLTFHNLVDSVTEKLCELNKKNNDNIFLIDDNNHTMLFKNYQKCDPLKRNPMIIGDCACYFTKNTKKFTNTDFLKIVVESMKELNIDYKLHFLSAKYQTHDYSKGGKELYKGYMLPILEKLSKTKGILIDKNYILEKNENIL